MKILYKTMDLTLRWVHVFIVVFCVTGWLHPDTRFYNLILVALIALSWFGLGVFKGLGYCLVTDIHWKIKGELGEELKTKSFMKYELDGLTGKKFNEKNVNFFTQVCFYLSAVASTFTNYWS